MTFGVGVITRNRSDVCTATVAAIEAFTVTAHCLVVGVDPADTDGTHDRLLLAGVAVVQPVATGIPANRNAVLRHLYDAGCTTIAVFEDDYQPAVVGWDLRYLAALASGCTDVLLGHCTGDPVHAHDEATCRVVWRPNMGCPLIVVTRRVLDTIGGWNLAFADRYGCDDGEYLARARAAGLCGHHTGWPSLADAARLGQLVDAPSSDGKTDVDRQADIAANMPLLHAALNGTAATCQPF